MAAEHKPKARQEKRIGELRCPNCAARFRPDQGARQATCPSCRWEWYVSWTGSLAKIRKPVWESWDRQMAEEAKEG